ncbi:short-chain collagen C4-like isoform X3 [Pomacea canaliculata]|nr:short-chain collagen C4-like isoform X3 [Pomacea canaliculata]
MDDSPLTTIDERNKLLSKLVQNLTATRDQLLSAGKAGVGGWSSSYIRWGRSECPNGSEIVYRGFVGGSSYDSDGAAANRLCLTATPRPSDITGARTYIYGAEYKFAEHHDMDVVCAVCRARLAVTVMVPGTDVCPEGWTLQYAGHLTAGMVGHRAASEYLCLDANPEHRPGSHESRNGALFYYVFAQCGSLPCPPYTNMYLTCAVCSR